MQTMCLMKFAISKPCFAEQWVGGGGAGLRDRNSFDVRGEKWSFERVGCGRLHHSSESCRNCQEEQIGPKLRWLILPHCVWDLYINFVAGFFPCYTVWEVLWEERGLGLGWRFRGRSSFGVRGVKWSFESAVAVEGSTIAVEAAEVVKKNKLDLHLGAWF